jgi:FkbM family methyltransferase
MINLISINVNGQREIMRSITTIAREYNDMLMRRFGWRVVLESSTFQAQRAAIMREKKVTLALDIGANVGQWATSVRGSGFTGKIISFEPDPRAITALKAKFARDSNWMLFETAVGHENSELILFQFPKMVEGMSSLKRPVSKTAMGQTIASPTDQISQISVPVRRLDDLLSDLDGAVTHLKIDVQGFELEVLRGSTKILQKCSVVEIEMPFVSAYENSTQFLEISKFLIEQGFAASTIQTERWSYPVALDCDALFIRA